MKALIIRCGELAGAFLPFLLAIFVILVVARVIWRHRSTQRNQHADIPSAMDDPVYRAARYSRWLTTHHMGRREDGGYEPRPKL